MVIHTDTARRPLPFTMGCVGAAGAFLGIFIGAAQGSVPLGIGVGAVLMAGLSWALVQHVPYERLGRWAMITLFATLGFAMAGLPGTIVGGLMGWGLGWFSYWISTGSYRRGLQPYLTSGQVLWFYTFRVICGAIFVFLITPILVVLPLSFNAQDFFTFTPEMLRF
ncbi:MAG: ABC transporter permease, partial [Pseudomonadota bacterium]